jgi:uncharacterized protein (TIGR02246 family)
MTSRTCRMLTAAMRVAILSVVVAGALRAAPPQSAASSSPAGPPPAKPTPPAVSAEADTAIRAANAQWLPAMKRRDVAAILAPYAEDALFVTSEGEALRGRASIADLYRKRLAAIAAVTGGDIVSDGRVVAASDLVYEWGHASLVLTRKDGTQAKGGGPYLTVWRRDSSGHWLIIRNVVF